MTDLSVSLPMSQEGTSFWSGSKWAWRGNLLPLIATALLLISGPGLSTTTEGQVQRVHVASVFEPRIAQDFSQWHDLTPSDNQYQVTITHYNTRHDQHRPLVRLRTVQSQLSNRIGRHSTLLQAHQRLATEDETMS